MLTEVYIEALLVDEELADQVWEAWDDMELSDFVAAVAWQVIANTAPKYPLLWAQESGDDKP